MTEKETGGAAFPLSPGDVPYYQEGVTLRDYFAAQIAGHMWNAACRSGDMKFGDQHLATDAATFYRMADAMLEARK